MTTALVLDAMEQAIWTRNREGHSNLDGLIHYNDAGSQGEFQWSSQYLEVEVRYGMAEGSNYASYGTAGDAVAGAACAAVRGGAGVLAADRHRCLE